MIIPSRFMAALALIALVVALSIAVLAVNNQSTQAQATRLDLTPDGGGTTAGSPFSVTVTAYDASDNVDTTYTGTVSFASSDSAAVLPATYTFQLSDSGSHIFSVTLVTAGTHSIAVVDTVNGSLNDADYWSVSVGPAHHIIVSPDSTSIVAGNIQVYAAEAFDQYNNSRGSVTSSTSFTISPGAGGSWTGNVYTSQYAGTWTVTGNYVGITDTAYLTVIAGSADYIVVSPDTASLVAGNSQAYTAAAFDQYDNSLGDVTSGTSFTISSGAGGSWTANVYSSQYVGTWTVTGDHSGITDTASLVIIASAADHIVISPDAVTITAGDNVTYTAEAFDQYNNSLGDVTSGTAFSIDLTAGGVWSANIYASQNVGTWTVTGNYAGTPDNASLIVNSNSADHIAISPDTVTVTAGDNVTYTAEAFDQFNNSLGDVTSATVFIIDTSAGGVWSANIYASQNVGTWTVTGNYAGITDNASITVSSGFADHIAVSPVVNAIIVGDNVTYTVEAFDVFNNSLGDVTSSTGLSIDAAAGGSWSANVYTSQYAGIWTVTGDYTGIVGTASLTVQAGPASSIIITPDSPSVAAGGSVTYTAQAFDQYNNSAGDVTGSTTFSIDPLAGGSWANNVYTSQYAGTWTVTGDYSGITDTDILTVTAGSAVSIVITPAIASIASGESVSYTVEAVDQFNNSLSDATAITVFSIDVAAGGSWSANVYTSQYAGIWTVTGDCEGILGTASLAVGAGAIISYTVTSDNYSLETSIAFTVTVTAYDAYGNVATNDNTTVVTMSSNSPTMIFDGNGNGLFGETGDNTKTLSGGTFDIQAKDNTATEGITITASDGGIQATSGSYTVENFRCFIATAAYGTPMAGEIQILRDFRDKYLITNPPGRLFVAVYYKLSPPVARLIADHDSLRTGIRMGLTPVLWLASAALKTTLPQKLAILALVLAVTLIAVLCLRRIRRAPTA